jgi:hypothetical protein
MSNFHIVQEDPSRYREQILQFWKEYLPGTPPSRFEWMHRGNPAGPSRWFFAFDSKTNELAGVISIMPTEIILQRQKIRAGILGDFMISKKYRVFGPNLLLPRAVRNNLAQLDLKFIYTIPNAESEKTAKREGFNIVGIVHNFVKPLSIRHYLNKYMHPLVTRLLSPLVDIGLRIFSRELYIPATGYFKEVAEIDNSFEHFWHEIQKKQTDMIGDHQPAHLTWRYLQNPLYTFRVLTYRKNPAGNLLGFIVFTIHQNKLYIYDVIALDKRYTYKLLKKMIKIGRKVNCLSIHIQILETNPLLPVIKSFRFIDAHDDVNLLFYSEQTWDFGKFNFFAGNRNL